MSRQPDRKPIVGGPPARPRGPTGGGCLSAETLVHTPHGLRRIDALRPDDEVSTPDGNRVIVEIRKHSRDNIVQIDFGDGNPICCSAEHGFLTSENILVKAEDIGKTGSKITSDNGDELNAILTKIEGEMEVYEIFLERKNDLIFVGADRVATETNKEI